MAAVRSDQIVAREEAHVSAAPTKRMDDGPIRRPVGVTILMWLGVAQGLLLLGFGGLLVAVRSDREVQTLLEADEMGVVGVGVVLVVVGLVRLGLAIALGRGSEVVRSMFGAVAMVQAGAAVYSLVALRDMRVAVAWPFALAVVELHLLYGSDRAQQFFAR